MWLAQIDMRNPLVHMTLWNLIACGGLLLMVVLVSSFSVAGREAVFQSSPGFLLGMGFWVLVALVISLLGGVVTGALVWGLTFSALVSDRTITRYYFSVWVWLGAFLLVSNSLMAWWFISNEQWLTLPLVRQPALRDTMLAVVWMVVVPLIGATRFIDDLKADSRYLRKRPRQDSSPE
ncbi:MAG: hypothetical protein ACFE0Q_16520 [Anaerolineae bacterium]